MNAPAKMPSDAALTMLRETATRVRTIGVAIELWEKVFSHEERKRLGADLNTALQNRGVIRMWTNLHGCTDVRAVLDIALAVNLLSSTHHKWLMNESGEFLDADAAYADAINRNDLVLNSASREIYWKGEPIDLDWSHEAKWYFIWELARHAKADRPIDRMTFGEKKKPNYVSKMKSDLTNRDGFPAELADLIEPCGTGTQKLQLPPEQIRIFERLVGDEIREWLP